MPETWAKYANRFRRAASNAGHDANYVERCLKYAKSLAEKGLPIAYDQYHLSRLMGVDYFYILRCSNSPGRFYRQFEIAKRNGNPRRISAPLPTLQRIQTWILQEILASITPSPFAHAFSKGCSIRANAKYHLRQPVVLKVDIKDFFPSIRIRAVYHLFRELGYTRPVSAILSGLTTLDGSLPQGAPTSPAISNLICREIDDRIAAFCLARKWRFTRYADDMTFSGELNVSKLLRFVRYVLREYGFKINEAKTRVLRRHQRQCVTGVVVNHRTRAPRSLRRQLRQMAYFIEKHGLTDHMARLRIPYANYHAHLLGKAHHVLFLDSSDSDAKKLIALLAPIQQ